MELSWRNKKDFLSAAWARGKTEIDCKWKLRSLFKIHFPRDDDKPFVLFDAKARDAKEFQGSRMTEELISGLTTFYLGKPRQAIQTGSQLIGGRTGGGEAEERGRARQQPNYFTFSSCCGLGVCSFRTVTSSSSDKPALTQKKSKQGKQNITDRSGLQLIR